jgi:uncharacterized protein YcfJ
MSEETENTEVKNESSTGFEVMDKASGYAKGAVMGGIAGFLFAATTGKRPILWTIIGVVGGGWIGYRIAEATDASKISKFNFTGEKKVKRKFKNSN